MKFLELKIPPVIVSLLFALTMWCLSFDGNVYFFDPFWRMVIAVLVVVIGILFAIGGVIAFRQAQTTVNPGTPEASSTIVASGVYKISRNPMYVGFLLVLLAWALFLAHVWPLWLLPLFVLYMNRYQIEPEEKALAAKFGDSYTRYRQSVRRWL
jgi:protein-S-isoprenylcysteine O-methyltransferase Ste14